MCVHMRVCIVRSCAHCGWGCTCGGARAVTALPRMSAPHPSPPPHICRRMSASYTWNQYIE